MDKIKNAATRAPVAATFAVIWGSLLAASVIGLMMSRGDNGAIVLHGLFFIFSAYKLSRNAAVVLDRRDYAKRELPSS